MQGDSDFIGAKLALFIGENLAVIRRDDTPGLIWPGHWDFPGGGRERGETPAVCAIRETQEELGIAVPENALVWSRAFRRPDGALGWFFAARMPVERAADIRLGDEGQAWCLMSPKAYLENPLGIPHFKERLRLYLLTVGRG